MQERYRDEKTKETTVERTKYFDELFSIYKNIKADRGYRQSLMFTVPERNKDVFGLNGSRIYSQFEPQRDIFLINNGDSGTLQVVPDSLVISRKLVKPAEELEKTLLNRTVRDAMEGEVEKVLGAYIRGLKSIADMPHNKYKEKFNLNKGKRKYRDNTAYINPRKLRNICERGTVGNLCYSYNYATGQIGFHTYRGDKWNRDRAVDVVSIYKGIDEKGRKVYEDERREQFSESRPLNNENNLLTAQIIDRVMENAQRRLLAGEVSREDMEKITNSATGMPTVYMGTALLDCPKEKEDEYRKYEEQYEKNPESVDVKKLFYDIHDFFESDEKARNFFSFEDCGDREKSSFGEKVAAFRRESGNKPVEREETDRFTSEKLDYVTGPCDYYSNIQRWNNNEGNVINSSLGLLVGDIDAINTKIEGDKLLISVHEGKSAKTENSFRGPNGEINNPEIEMPQDIFYRIFINMLRIGTENGLQITIGDRSYKVELDGRYNKIYGVSRCIIDDDNNRKVLNNPAGRLDVLKSRMEDKTVLDSVNNNLPEKSFDNINEYANRAGRESIYAGEAGDKEFHRELKSILKTNGDRANYFYLCSTDKHPLPGMDMFYHCRRHGIAKGTDDGTDPISYKLRTSLFVQDEQNGEITQKPNNCGTQLFASRGRVPNISLPVTDNEFAQMNREKKRLTEIYKKKKKSKEEFTEQEKAEMEAIKKAFEEVGRGHNLNFKIWQDNLVKCMHKFEVASIKEKYEADLPVAVAEATKIIGMEFYNSFYDAFALENKGKKADGTEMAARNEIAQKREQVKATTVTAG